MQSTSWSKPLVITPPPEAIPASCYQPSEVMPPEVMLPIVTPSPEIPKSYLMSDPATDSTMELTDSSDQSPPQSPESSDMDISKEEVVMGIRVNEDSDTISEDYSHEVIIDEVTNVSPQPYEADEHLPTMTSIPIVTANQFLNSRANNDTQPPPRAAIVTDVSHEKPIDAIEINVSQTRSMNNIKKPKQFHAVDLQLSQTIVNQTKAANAWRRWDKS